MDLKSKSGRYSKYSDWLRDSTTLFRFLAMTYYFTSPPSIAVCKNARSCASTPAHALLESHKDSFSLQHAGRVWGNTLPSVLYSEGRKFESLLGERIT